EHALRPSVRGDVMEGHQQDVFLLTDLQQLHAQHGACSQVERLVPFALDFSRRPLALLGLNQLAEVIEWQPDLQLRLDDLDRLAIDVYKAGPQALVPVDDGLNRSAERLDVQFAI